MPLYVMNVTYPLVDDEILDVLPGKRAVLLVEEGQPDYIEQNLNTILRRAGFDVAVARQGHAAGRRRVHLGGGDQRACAKFLALTCPS